MTDAKIATTLPAGFKDLEPLVDRWAGRTIEARTKARCEASMEDIMLLYDVMVERAPAILDYLKPFPLDAIEGELMATGVADGHRTFNLTWHDWLNLRSLVEISRVITLAALGREDSRGAHFRSDYPEAGDLATTTFTVVTQRDGRPEVTHEPVVFSIVKPGETLLKDKQAAE